MIAVEIEPARYAMTGANLGAHTLRDEFRSDGLAYWLDAPHCIASGSLQADAPDADGSVYVTTSRAVR